jgi:hypothetical protein
MAPELAHVKLVRKIDGNFSFIGDRVHRGVLLTFRAANRMPFSVL